MWIGVVSDTHGHVPQTLAAMRMLEAWPVEAILHCGDIGSAEIPGLFARWPTHFVLGNVDQPAEVFEQAVRAAGQHFHGRHGLLELAGRRIAFLHGDDSKLLAACWHSNAHDLVCYGHTHQPRLEQCGQTWLLNPGALYRARPHTLAVVDLVEMRSEIIRVDAE